MHWSNSIYGAFLLDGIVHCNDKKRNEWRLWLWFHTLIAWCVLQRSSWEVHTGMAIHRIRWLVLWRIEHQSRLRTQRHTTHWDYCFLLISWLCLSATGKTTLLFEDVPASQFERLLIKPECLSDHGCSAYRGALKDVIYLLSTAPFPSC